MSSGMGVEKPRKLPRVSKARGGLMPGFDGNNIAAQVQELEDLEYI